MNEPVACSKALEEQLWQWLETVVIGLNLCPFAAGPHRRGLVSLVIADVSDEAAVLETLVDEIIRLDETAPDKLDTTLIAVPGLWPHFTDFNEFLATVDDCLRHHDREGVYQVASFHPAYQFAGTAANAAENLTNRAPVPILHLLREDSVSEAVARYPDTSQIPERNVASMEALSSAEQKRLFPWLFSGNHTGH